jgi:hypothetical protein
VTPEAATSPEKCRRKRFGPATARLKPALARQVRAARAMDTIDMTFDPAPARQEFPDLPNTDMPTAVKELFA